MKVKALIQCSLEIEYEDDNLASDINITQENIEMSRIDELIGLETEDSIQMISVSAIRRV